MPIEYDEEYITPQNPDYNRAVSKAEQELKRLKQLNAERQRRWRMNQKIKNQEGK